MQPGTWFGKYQLVHRLARGGMGEVWVAREPAPRGDRLVAVKTMLEEHVGNPRYRAMFLDETRIFARLDHPNVVRLLDAGEHEDASYLVMDLSDGTTLSVLLRDTREAQRTVPTGVALRITADICAGLHACHELRDESGTLLDVIHRDVSPQNVLVELSGACKLIDFGIAKMRDRRVYETTTGVIKGKAHYLAPEQIARPEQVDRRADIWAVGCILHELLSGQPPWATGNDVVALARLVRGDAPPPLHDAPPVLARLLERALAPDPGRRFPTAEAMRVAVEAALVELGERGSRDDVRRFAKPLLSVHARARDEKVRSALAELEPPRQPPGASGVGMGESVSTSPWTVARPRSASWRVSALGVLAVGATLAFAAHLAGAGRPVAAGPPPVPPPLPSAGEVVLELDDEPAARMALASEGAASPSAEPVHEKRVPLPRRRRVPSGRSSAGGAAGTEGRPAAMPSPATPAAASPACDPPFTVDAHGNRTYLRECLQ